MAMKRTTFVLASLLLAALLLLAIPTAFSLDDDFGFELTDDIEVELDTSTRRLWGGGRLVTTPVGRVLHLVVPKTTFGGGSVRSFEAKTANSKPLPLWLLFDKSGGVFWGVPLAEDVGTVPITVKSIGGTGENGTTEVFTINVVVDSTPRTLEKCPPGEDNTLLTLLIDRSVRSIKPKQRVVAINNIGKFLGLPFSAFTLRPQKEEDDLTDSSVVLAGPGNLRVRTSKLTSLLQVPVGCEGRLWVQTAPLVHQLKQQARDGTIAEVLGLPLVGWRVRTEGSAVFRAKRQADDYGSGDYDDYYDEYDDEYEDGEETPVDPAKGASSPSSATTTPTTVAVTTPTSTTTPSNTHPHRHHHGEIKTVEDIDFSIPMQGSHHPSSSTSKITFVPTTTTTTPFTTTRITTAASTTTSTTNTSTTPLPSTEQPSTRTTTKEPITSTTSANKSQNPNPVYEYEYEDYDSEDDDDDENGEPTESRTIIPNLNPIVKMENITNSNVETSPSTSTSATTIKDILVDTSSSSTTSTTTTTTTTTSEEPTTHFIVEDTEPSYPVTTFRVVTDTEPETDTPTTTSSTIFSTNVYPSTFTTSTTTMTTTTMTPATTTINSTTTTTTATPVPVATTKTATTTTQSSTSISTQKLTTTDNDFTTLKSTTIRNVMSTPRTTTIREITETIDYEQKNFQPFIENRLKQMSVIAGKIFRFVIPQNTFKDLEDGYNLTLEFLNSNSQPIGKDSWCHFNPHRHEIYGLPLEEDVFKWEYVIRATDKEGASVSDRLTIQVQQHKSQRVVNHEFSLLIRIEKHQEFPHYIDWCLKTLRALNRIYKTDMTEVTVRHINYTSEPVVFTWTNDSVPTSYCPKTEIERLYQQLTANDHGDPSKELNLALAPELRVKKVLYRGLGICETPQIPVTPPTNFRPFLRNPVDQINATVGELLIFRVPDDTFYDPEDTDSRILNITLLTADRQPISAENWLQFDHKNREFYGIPKKPGRSEYQLVCVDSAGLPATDSLEIVVYPAPKINYNVEFSMTIETTYDTFVNSATMQKKFVEKLQQVFGDHNASHIHMSPFKPKHESTIVTWFNKSLSTTMCPHKEINRLESIMKNHEHGISSTVHSIMDPEFPVSTIKVLPIGNCKPKPPPIEERTPVDESSAEVASNDYMITFIVPAVIIGVMLFLAALAACVLYRRRRTGKMNVEEDGRQSYGNKGIPVIFQEELEEKPESGTKTPVILKDEKPPLAPPEYSKSGSLKLNDDSEPYQPPPPFPRAQDNGRQPRPKPTPTYRKPPPYVPP